MCHLLLKGTVYLIVVLAAMLSGVTRAEIANLGPIEAYSATKVTVKKGDRVTLEVKLSSGNDVKVRWASGDLTLSEKPTCLLVTDHYAIGRYPVVLTVMQGEEQFVLSYELTVEPMPISGRPRSVVVPMENSGTDLMRVSPSMFVAKPIEGQAFRDDGRGMESMTAGWRPLTFGERLKTHPEARLLFGLPGHEHHVLGERTDVWLAQEKGASVGDQLPEASPNGPLRESAFRQGDRLIILLEGMLRSRQIDHQPPQWTILIPRMGKSEKQESESQPSPEAEQVFHTWLQLKADEDGDVLVIREKKRSRTHRQKPLKASSDGEKVHIFVLRGTARLTRTLCAPDFDACLEKSTSDILVMRAGTSLVLEADRDEAWGQGQSPWLSVPDPRMLERGFAETTPQYRPEQDPRRLGPAWTLLGQRMARTPELAKLNAEKALLRGDWLVAIEEIQPYLSSVGDAAHLILGRAYTGLGLSTYAKQYLDLTLQFQRDQSEPYLLLAHLALSERRWKEAAQYLSTYDKVGGPDGPWLSYYHGVVADRLSDRRFARREMLASLRQTEGGASREAAQIFVDAIDQDTIFTSSLTTGVFYDSRILRSKVDQELRTGPEALRVDKAGGGQFSAAFQIRGYQDPEAELKVEGLLDGKFFFDERLRVLNPIHPEIALRLALQPGGDGLQAPWLRAEMRPFLGTRVLGQRRALDEIGADLGLTSPRLNHVALGMRTLLSKDPSPKYDDLIEPSLRELVLPDDQSHHEVRYWTGARLFEDKITKIAAELAQGDYRYDGRTRKIESFTSQELALLGEHALWPYHDLRWNMSFLKRSFTRSEDQRRDLDVNLALSWSFSQSPLLSHIFGVGYEKQSSTRASQDFSRETAQYQMRFDF